MKKQNKYMAPSMTVVEMETEYMLATSVDGFDREISGNPGAEFESIEIGTWQSDIWDDEE